MVRMISMGIDGLITDEPARLQQLSGSALDLEKTS